MMKLLLVPLAFFIVCNIIGFSSIVLLKKYIRNLKSMLNNLSSNYASFDEPDKLDKLFGFIENEHYFIIETGIASFEHDLKRVVIILFLFDSICIIIAAIILIAMILML